MSSVHFVTLTLAALAALGGCGGRDVDKLCPIAEAVQTDGAIAPAAKHDEFVKRATGEMSSTAGKNIVQALTVVAPADRSAVLKKGAEEVGRGGYSCPAYDAIAAAK